VSSELPKPGEYSQLQKWLLNIISHPDGTEAGARALESATGIQLNDIVEDGPNLTAMERVDVYTDMYFWRLVDILRGDFPSLVYCLGEERFNDLAKACLAKYPPHGYSLQCLGKSLPGFLREGHTTGDEPSPDFLAELAELELAKELAFDADPDEAVEEDALARLTPDQWEALRFVPMTSLTLLKTTFPIAPFANALDADEEPKVPSREESYCALVRPHHGVELIALGAHEFTLLHALAEGATLLDGLERLLETSNLPPDALMEELMNWFTRWGSHQFFSDLEFDH